MDNSKYQIILDKNSREEIRIEDAEKIKDAIANKKTDEIFFHEEYTKADAIVKSIMASSHNSNGNQRRDFHGTIQDNEFSGNFYTNPNESRRKKDDNSSFSKSNIIAFSGNRGTGKTTAMVSFGKYLEGYKVIKLLEMIDPSHFEKNQSILLNVITLLFKSVKKHLEDKKLSPPTELLQAFEKVFKSVKRMDEEIPTESSLEYLNQLSDSLGLSESIKKLIKESLDFFSKKSDNDDAKFEYLVLMIDDLDVNVAHAPKMLEQIRKFLIHKNLIILIATNIDQLQLEMQEHYSIYFEKTYNTISKTSDICVDVEDMATKYLLKLFPPLQRIHIGNTADKLIKTDIKIKGVTDKDGKEVEPTTENLQRKILTLIWEKTRLIFIPRKGYLHPIIPTNLRALNQFVNILIDMDFVPIDENSDNYDKMFQGEKEYEAVKGNFYKFKDYIMNVWIPSNVSFEGQKVFDNIPQELGRINKHLIQSINVLGAQYKKKLIAKENSLLKEERKEKDIDGDIYTFVSRNDPRFLMTNKISDIINFPSNNSMGDVLLLVDKYKTYFESENETNFIEAVKIYYTMLLFETMFFDEGSIFPLDRSSEFPKNITNIQKLIGGTIYFPHYFEIIKDTKYDKKIADIKETYKIINKINANIWSKKGKNNEWKNFLKRLGIPVSQMEAVEAIIKKDLPPDKNMTNGNKLEEGATNNEALITLDGNKLEEGATNNEALITLDGNKLEEGATNNEALITLDELVLAYVDNVKKKYLKGEDVSEHLFYHEVEEKANLGKVFTIQYYGKSRPDRSYDTHIYDTTKESGEEDGKWFFKFDILSLLVNILNPYHTIDRFISQAENMPDGELNKYDKWMCNIDDNGRQVTNILLPIYSVDLVLSYLREHYDLRYLICRDLIKECKKLKDTVKELKDQKGEIEEIQKKQEEFEEKRKELEEKYNKSEELDENEMRGKKNIENYYNELSDLTKEKLERIDFNNNIYSRLKKIYEKSVNQLSLFQEVKAENEQS